MFIVKSHPPHNRITGPTFCTFTSLPDRRCCFQKAFMGSLMFVLFFFFLDELFIILYLLYCRFESGFNASWSTFLQLVGFILYWFCFYHLSHILHVTVQAHLPGLWHWTPIGGCVLGWELSPWGRPGLWGPSSRSDVTCQKHLLILCLVPAGKSC